MKEEMTFVSYIPTEDESSSDIIDLFEYKTLDGTVKNIDGETFNYQHNKDIEELTSIINQMKMNSSVEYIGNEELSSQNHKNTEDLDDVISQLKRYSRDLENGAPDFGLENSSKDNSNLITVDFYAPPDNKSRKSYFCKDRIHKFKTNLVRTAVMAGVVLGLTAATKASLNLGVIKSQNQYVSTEKETTIATNNLQKLVNKTIKSTPLKKSKEKLGFIKLGNTKLSYTSMNDGPTVNTKDLKCDSYKVHYAAIFDDSNNLMDVIDVSKKQEMSIHKFKKNCKKVYGDNINIQINVDGVVDGKVVYDKAGWVSIEKSINNDSKAHSKCI